jgi:hypothetical protein
LAEALPSPVETGASRERPSAFARFNRVMSKTKEKEQEEEEDKVGETIEVSHQAARELERELKRNPDDLDAKVDVGSNESMDASDPTAASQPGQKDDPVPSSGFPE